jgi:hypothetical protein
MHNIHHGIEEASIEIDVVDSILDPELEKSVSAVMKQYECL